VKLHENVLCRLGAAILLAAAAGLSTGCSLMRPPMGSAGAAAKTHGGVAAEIEDLRASLLTGKAPPAARLDLALLLIHPTNPDRDYQAALRELEQYEAADPSGAERDDVQTWLAALRSLEDLELEKAILEVRVKSSAADAAGAHQALDRAKRELVEAKRAREALAKESADKDEQLSALRRENKEMKETIEKLKELDLRMDKLRRGVR
jgi:hypothetical protein